MKVVSYGKETFNSFIESIFLNSVRESIEDVRATFHFSIVCVPKITKVWLFSGVIFATRTQLNRLKWNYSIKQQNNRTVEMWIWNLWVLVNASLALLYSNCALMTILDTFPLKCCLQTRRLGELPESSAFSPYRHLNINTIFLLHWAWWFIFWNKDQWRRWQRRWWWWWLKWYE